MVVVMTCHVIVVLVFFHEDFMRIIVVMTCHVIVVLGFFHEDFLIHSNLSFNVHDDSSEYLFERHQTQE